MPTFPLTLALATILTTGTALALTALNIQWSHPTPDALPLAWTYANVSMLLTTLTLWPIRKTPTPLLDAATIIITAIPALTVAALLSNITLTTALPTLTTQLALILLTLGTLQWRTHIPQPLIAATLTTLAAVAPIFAYLWPEFLPAAPQSWLTIIPAIAITHTSFWPAILYALLGSILTLTAPRGDKVTR